MLFIDDLLSVLSKVPLVGIFGLLAVVFEKPLSMAINTLNKIITTINEKIQVPELNASIENLKPYATLMKDLLIVFGAVTIVGILAATAIIGGLLLAAAVKVIFVVLSKAFESIKANVVDDKTHEALYSMTRLIIIMSGLMLVAALVGFVYLNPNEDSVFRYDYILDYDYDYDAYEGSGGGDSGDDSGDDDDSKPINYINISPGWGQTTSSVLLIEADAAVASDITITVIESNDNIIDEFSTTKKLNIPLLKVKKKSKCHQSIIHMSNLIV